MVFLALFPPFSSSFPKPFLSGSQCDESSVLRATAGAARGEPSWRLEGGCSPRTPAGWAARGSSPHPCLLFPQIEVRDGGRTGMTGCGKRRGKKPLGEGLQLALLEVWGTSASLQWETQRGKAGQICGGKSEL